MYNINWEDHVTNDNIKELAKIETIAIETSSMVWACVQKR